MRDDDDKPTPRMTQRTVLGLDETVLLLRRLDRHVGLAVTELRRELEALHAVFSRWPEHPPDNLERNGAITKLSDLMRRVHALDHPDDA